MFRILSKTISLAICLLLIQNVYSQTQNQFLKAAQKAYNTAMYDEAISYYKQALKFNEKDQEIAYKIALSYFNLKDYNNANTFFTKIDNIESDALFNYYKAQNYKYLGDYKNAISHFEKFSTDYPIDGFYRKKTIQEIASCHWALNQTINNKTKIKHYNKPLNTPYSDFGANYIDSNTIQLTSLLPLKQDNTEYQSSLFFYQKDNDKFKELKNLSFSLNEQDSFSYANGIYLKDKREFYYNKCYTSHEDYEKTCDLFVRKFDGKNWQTETPLSINTIDFTETQAHVFINKSGETELYFVSDRLGGAGKLDIWRTKEISYGNYTTPENVSEINTIDNEATPFYNESEQKLYFSSSWYYGFGGYDIFVSNIVNGKIENPKNLGMPINSSSDDIYYYPTTFNSALFSSNREGALTLKNSACCFDVFEQEMIEKITTKDSLTALNNKVTEIIEKNSSNDNKKLLDKIQNQLPATVYFHNDEPNPKTTETLTKLSYLDAYNSYFEVKSDYSVQLKNNDEVTNWFNEVKNHYNQLNIFLADIETLLKQKESVTLLIEGYCSPLALNYYNINLAKRRIVSVENYILKWNNGALQNYFNGGYLRFKNAPFGEEKANQTISDSTEEIEKSIYSKAASLERRVSILAIEIEKK